VKDGRYVGGDQRLSVKSRNLRKPWAGALSENRPRLSSPTTGHEVLDRVRAPKLSLSPHLAAAEAVISRDPKCLVYSVILMSLRAESGLSCRLANSGSPYCR
jgi:hypothetical protein